MKISAVDKTLGTAVIGVLEAFKSMVSGQHGRFHRVVVANILKNLCAYAKPDSDCQYSMQKFSVDNISMALRTMYQTDNLIGEDMEAFLGLVLQFSKLLCETDFIEAVNGNGIGLRNFVQKLKLILKQANSHRTEASVHPGIRRSAIEQVIWMAQLKPEPHCIDHFIDCEMRDDLVMAQQTARRAWQENFKLSSGGVSVLEYEESLRSVASRALKLILGVGMKTVGNDRKNPLPFPFSFYFLENRIGMVYSETVTISVMSVYRKQNRRNGNLPMSAGSRKFMSETANRGIIPHLTIYEDDLIISPLHDHAATPHTTPLYDD
ncbi:uncharacterized protein LOC127785936 [Oryza glaberrima]|uniref:uncharacterized protein LOC127785936 n=1 Tax=Oryza glaberrima TaxID=4538 RepID=UPI00224C4692|nr:uncharacterized protein LOC127785936 [Oryza glaberrima]